MEDDSQFRFVEGTINTSFKFTSMIATESTSGFSFSGRRFIERLKFRFKFFIIANIVHELCRNIAEFVVTHVGVSGFGILKEMSQKKVFAAGTYTGYVFWLPSIQMVSRLEILIKRMQTLFSVTKKR